ncbi:MULTISPECIES: PaaI family thioesterase [Roseobacteraceae]|jgi:acyl-coenzyme A thioesterase PaaI-like protein|uniref:Thioesterase n=1 Tax=Pseudosulfitobacter pseudonitzschiae TaxID=1402135 RepID=A0A221K2C1_9RHOB|nr:MULTISPECIES: PaaI family thioesterase [Roseobacteraceae]ASM73131.1 thioesterase [Pseudosulfitobacter pseudonitzschiae]
MTDTEPKTPARSKLSVKEKQALHKRWDAALGALTQSVPYNVYLGVEFDRRGDELTAILPFQDKLIGNPFLPAIHGGVTAAFLEITAVTTLSRLYIWERLASGQIDLERLERGEVPSLPKTIDFTVDYLRSGLPRESYARARISRAGRRYASVHVEAWQDDHTRLFAQATGHFLMPQKRD